MTKFMSHRTISQLLAIPLITLALGLMPAAAQQPCENLTGLSLPGIKITLASPVPAGDFVLPSARANAAPVKVPAFCRVAGIVKPEVNFEVWLPTNWNHKFLAVGNGGLAGTISYAAMVIPLERGYATASTDTGHSARDEEWALGHMERVIDFAHRAVHVMTQAGKGVVQAYYGAVPAHSYFQGCSQGGQEALTEAQRYPLDYDGIIAGDPANYWTHLYMARICGLRSPRRPTPRVIFPRPRRR